MRPSAPSTGCAPPATSRRARRVARGEPARRRRRRRGAPDDTHGPVTGRSLGAHAHPPDPMLHSRCIRGIGWNARRVCCAGLGHWIACCTEPSARPRGRSSRGSSGPGLCPMPQVNCHPCTIAWRRRITGEVGLLQSAHLCCTALVSMPFLFSFFLFFFCFGNGVTRAEPKYDHGSVGFFGASAGRGHAVMDTCRFRKHLPTTPHAWPLTMTARCSRARGWGGLKSHMTGARPLAVCRLVWGAGAADAPAAHPDGPDDAMPVRPVPRSVMYSWKDTN